MSNEQAHGKCQDSQTLLYQYLITYLLVWVMLHYLSLKLRSGVQRLTIDKFQNKDSNNKYYNCRQCQIIDKVHKAQAYS